MSTIEQTTEPTIPPTAETGAEKEPDTLPAVTDTAPSLDSAPTDSHALATDNHEEKGVAQFDHTEPEVKDLGWDEKPEHIPSPLVGGISNEDLWILVRRFNKVCVVLGTC